MKTDLTKRITSLLCHSYSPDLLEGIKLNKFRPQFALPEFPIECGTTTDGLVDVMWIAEYFKELSTHNTCGYPVDKTTVPDFCKMGLAPGSLKPEECTAGKCICKHKTTILEPHILFICCEIKISRQDFLSKHGHNFAGNLNYYVMPHELFKSCQKDIPDDIGVISLNSKEDGLRHVKSSTFKELTDEQSKWYLMSALKANRREGKKEERAAREERQRSMKNMHIVLE